MHKLIKRTKVDSSSHLAGDVANMIIRLAQKSSPGSREVNEQFMEQLRRIAIAFAQAMEEADEQISFRHAAEFSLLARKHRRPSTRADLRSYVNRMYEYEDFAELSLRSIRISTCRDMLQACFGHSAHTYRKAQSVLHSIFNMGIRQGWCSSNPAKAILRPVVCESRIEILTLSQIRSLMNVIRASTLLHSMDAPFRLMLWCGIRPTEVRRLCWGDIDKEEQVIYIEGRNSKTGGARAVPLRGGARSLLYQLPDNPDTPIAPRNWDRLWRMLRQQAGLTEWQNDALRHTFASMHLKRFHNLLLLQEEMGHSNTILLQTRYLNLRNLKRITARKFFSPESWK